MVLGGRLLDRALAVLAQNGGPSAGESLGAQLYLNKANALGRRGQHPEALVRRTITAGIWAVLSKSSSDDRTIVAGIFGRTPTSMPSSCCCLPDVDAAQNITAGRPKTSANIETQATTLAT